MNYCYGNCVICIEGDENIYSVVPYYKGVKLEKNVGYLKDGYVYIYRGDISRQKKFKNGVFSDKKGNVRFALCEADKAKYAFENIKDDSIQSIIKQAEKIDIKLKRKILREINQSSDIYLPEMDINDDFLKHLVKLVLHEKKVDIKQFKHKFSKSHSITNLKAALETKTTPDGKKGQMTLNNFQKWAELLDMDVEVIIKDTEDSELPCGKIFKYDSQDGYKVEWNEEYDYLREEEEGEQNEEENE